MIPLYIIHALNNDSGNEGYIGDETTYTNHGECCIQLIKLKEMDDCAKDIVAFFSKRRAREIRDEIALVVSQKYPDADTEFSVKERDFTYDDVDLIKARPPFKDGRK